MSLGRNVNVSIFDKAYQEKALRILKGQPMDAVIYETLAKAFSNLISGWYKTTHAPADDVVIVTGKSGKSVKEKPEYAGPVYVILGRSEEDIIVAIAYWKLRYETVVEQNRLQARINAANNVVTRLIKQRDKELAKQPEDRDREYIVTLIEWIDQAETLRDTLIAEHSKTRITNISVEDFQRFIKMAYSYVAQEIENAIPNCVVIESSTQMCILDGKTIELHIPDHDHATSSLLSNYIKGSGPKILRHTIADHIIICHPHAIYPNGTAREADRDGMRGYARVTVAPICVDSEYYREHTGFIVRTDAHVISKVVYDERHLPSILLFGVQDGMVHADVLPTDVLLMRKHVEDAEKTTRRVVLPPRYMWGMVATDEHWGGPSKCFVSKPNTDGIRRRFGMNEAVFQMWRDAGLCTPEKMPVHFWWAMDDMTQGRHFDNQNQLHHHLVPYYVVEELFTEAYNQSSSLKSAQEQLQKCV